MIKTSNGLLFEENQAFGMIYLKDPNLNAVQDSDIVMAQNGTLGILSLREIHEAIGGTWEETTLKNQ